MKAYFHWDFNGLLIYTFIKIGPCILFIFYTYLSGETNRDHFPLAKLCDTSCQTKAPKYCKAISPNFCLNGLKGVISGCLRPANTAEY